MDQIGPNIIITSCIFNLETFLDFNLLHVDDPPSIVCAKEKVESATQYS